jgi:hypothetical protein
VSIDIYHMWNRNDLVAELERLRVANKTLAKNVGPPPWIDGQPNAMPGPMVVECQGCTLVGDWNGVLFQGIDTIFGRNIVRHRRIPAAWLEAPK